MAILSAATYGFVLPKAYEFVINYLASRHKNGLKDALDIEKLLRERNKKDFLGSQKQENIQTVINFHYHNYIKKELNSINEKSSKFAFYKVSGWSIVFILMVFILISFASLYAFKGIMFLLSHPEML